jgi:hypothetical protein
MTLTIDLPPELEGRIREEAARAGLDTGTFIRNTLEERVHHAANTAAAPAHLPRTEADLLQKINEGLPPEMWQRYHELVARRRAETLTPEEQAELIALSDRVEAANTRRIEHLIELARLREISLEALMDQLGIKAPGYA